MRAKRRERETCNLAKAVSIEAKRWPGPFQPRPRTEARTLKSLLHGASDRANALFDQRRRLADVSHGLTAIVENAQVPLKAVLAVGGGRRLAVMVLVREILERPRSPRGYERRGRAACGRNVRGRR